MRKNSFLPNIALGGAIAFLLMLTGTALSALLIKGADITAGTVSAVSVIIKLVGVAAGVVYTCFRIRKKGALCGICTALVYEVLSCAFLFALGIAEISFALVFDLFITCAAGCICGIIGVNIFT